MLPTFNVDHSSSWCSNDIGLSFAQLRLGCRWVDTLISSLIITYLIHLGVALGVWIAGGISGGHINPAVN